MKKYEGVPVRVLEPDDDDNYQIVGPKKSRKKAKYNSDRIKGEGRFGAKRLRERFAPVDTYNAVTPEEETYRQNNS